MRVSKLIAEFDKIDTLPVDVNAVVDFLRVHQIKDEINFIGVDLDTNILRGKIYQFVIPGTAYREPTYCADVFYDRRQSDDWQRLVCCKELLHILDPEGMRAKTAEQIDHQIKRMVLPHEFQSIDEDGPQVISDKMAIYYAVATLFPFAARELLMKPFADGLLTGADVARIADIPERYALFVMSDDWPRIHAAFLGRN